MTKKAHGSYELLKEVVDSGLCSLCGACVGACPYLVPYDGRIAIVDACALPEGQCYQYCPRTYVDMDDISRRVFGSPYENNEIGTAREIFLARSTDMEICRRAQDGGTVTTLLSVAIAEGAVDAVVETAMDDDKVPRGFLARNRDELLRCAGVSYEPGATLQALNQLPKNSTAKLAVVGLPCQILSVRKMQASQPSNRVDMKYVKLVIGLFCGWTLTNGFHKYLREKFDLPHTVKFDVPHHPEHTFDIYGKSGKESVELDEISQYINPACSYCYDMTSEFADISVGSGRAAYKGWNTVVIRTENGRRLVDRAERKGLLEKQSIPVESVANLKRASLNKKKKALREIMGKTGDTGDLLYLHPSQNTTNMPSSNSEL